MSNDRRGTALVAGSGAVFGGAAALGHAENAYNAHVDRRFQRQRDAITPLYGLSESGQPINNPMARFKHNVHPVSPQVKQKLKEAKRRKYTRLNQINEASNKAKRIPLNGRMGRRWGLVGAGGALAYGGARDLSKADRRDVDAFAGGAAIGTLGYQGLAYAQMPYDRHSERKLADDPALRARAREYRRQANVPRGAKLGHPAWQSYFRSYPKDLPGGRAKRALSWTHGGKSGAAATTAAAVLAGGGAVHARRQHVGKALYREDNHVSVLRAGTTAAGLGLAGWGLSRSPMVGRALATGIKRAKAADNPYAVEALQRAQALSGVIRHGTGIGERQLRQIRAVDQAIQRVPAAIRPEVAAGAGILLVSGAHPVHRRSYEPVRVRINLNGRQA